MEDLKIYHPNISAYMSMCIIYKSSSDSYLKITEIIIYSIIGIWCDFEKELTQF